jgi:16S rRNA (guanine527-N7)-methyltransferase
LDKDLFDRKIADYIELLMKENKKKNLTAITDLEEIKAKHIKDSFQIANLINENQKVIDIGSGAGFPGIVVGIARPDLRVTLLDSRQKKVSFLEDVIQGLALSNMSAVAARVEDYGASHRNEFDYVVARAMARLDVLVEYAMPLLRKNGYLLSMKSEKTQEEIQIASRALKELNAEIVDRKEYEIEGKKREVLVIQKVKDTPEKFPRRAGMALKRPLGGK